MLGAFTFYETQLREFSEQLKSQNPIMKKVSGGGDSNPRPRLKTTRVPARCLKLNKHFDLFWAGALV